MLYSLKTKSYDNDGNMIIERKYSRWANDDDAAKEALHPVALNSMKQTDVQMIEYEIHQRPDGNEGKSVASGTLRKATLGDDDA